jgi:hypothetical protein
MYCDEEFPCFVADEDGNERHTPPRDDDYLE